MMASGISGISGISGTSGTSGTSDASDGGAMDNFVGPVIRAGDFADVVARSIEDDNPGRDVRIVDRGDYVRIQTPRLCRLTRKALERHLGHPYELRMLETEMPSFGGRLRTSSEEFIWFYDN